MSDATTSVDGPTLLSLPDTVLIDTLSPHLTSRDLVSLRRTSKRARAVFDDEVLWKRRTLADFSFPPHASARVGGWRKLYRGLERPQVWVWGQSDRGRLGLGAAQSEDQTLRRLTSGGSGGIPFPVKNDVVAAALASKTSDENPTKTKAVVPSRGDLGSVVELVAGGWSFHARTSTGKVIFWGTMDGEGYAGPHASLREPSREIDTPTLLDLPADVVVKQLSCGRSHAVALTDKGDVLEWRAWGTVWKHDGLLPLATATSSARVAQLEAGWDFTVVLVETSSSDDARDGSHGAARTDIYLWHSDLSDDRYRQTYFAELEESPFSRAWPERPNSDDSPARIQSPALKLPALPWPGDQTAEGLTQSTSPHRTVRIAAGENFVLALTESGLVYKLDVPPRHPSGTDRRRPDGSLRSHAEAQRLALARHLSGDADAGDEGQRCWKLLPHFCVPDRLRALSGLQGVVEGKSDAQLRISHISAHFRTFVVYTSDDPAEHQLHPQSEAARGSGRQRRRGGIVLLGGREADADTVPDVVPQLQDAGVIKVVLGDYHFGALTEDGEVWTWGSWSKGALGVWHDLPPAAESASGRGEDEGYDDTANLVPLPRVLPHFRVGGPAAAARIVPRLGSRAAARMAQSSAGAGAGGEEKRVPERVDQPTPVRFRLLQGEGRTVGEDNEQRRTTSFAFDVAFAGWHSSALVMDVDAEVDSGDAR
ncbi:uncharacterized protein PFL1_05318 [Pseudozyma flocculosa PF-1]|uniref:F-box domain-containing protein n=2 Tax=Pseudozyma flocculosa TaxID=84751 RepID=A0A5C3FEX8_9BASI|nr:uncharacterized protein PFL1_05318 [Pseudozyma flocculosa PF-1]EPQ27034.1 hypothetical protein PFL1_05318 [Pseudozyma flocculosa PF-1]SPO42031.1 uncharacterized protein PSFLO_07514 [Pseudozyma flocculosa]